MKRRALLQCGAAACAAACSRRVDEPLAIEVSAPVRGLISVPASRVPEVLQRGGSLLLHPEGVDFIGRPLAVLVANTTSQGLRAYSAYCPHAGCEVAWVDGEDAVVCPCHLSRFAVDGAVTHAPATADLDTYSAKLSPDQSTLIVDISGSGGVFPAAQGGQLTFTLQQLPALAALGGSVTGHSAGVPFPLLVMRTGPGQVVAYDARCPHLGCAVRGAQKLVICPCHGSLFNLDGSVKLGPSTKPLLPLKVDFNGTTVVVTVA